MNATPEDFSYGIHQLRQATQTLVATGAEVQSKILESMATRLEASQDSILEANTLDLEASLEMAVPELVVDWLKLTPRTDQYRDQNPQTPGLPGRFQGASSPAGGALVETGDRVQPGCAPGSHCLCL